jgi:hypothetical protein
LKRKGVYYSFKYDFNAEGGFQAWWSDVYRNAQSFRKDLGNKPLQAAVDPDAEKKIRMNGNYDPYNNHDDCLKLLVRCTLKYNALRGASEVSSMVFLFFLNTTNILTFFLFFSQNFLLLTIHQLQTTFEN